MVALHTVIAIAAVIFLIIKLKFDPIVALVLGALYLGLASGIGLMETVSAITDRVWEELERWRSRPLEPVYAFMFVDCLYVPVRRGRGARSMAVYAIVAYDLAGRKDVLGLWMQETEGAHHWMGVFDELRQRGVEDVLFVSMDGVSGLADGLRAIFPDAVAQRCLVHLVRNSCKYVPSKDMQAFCRDARAFYGAP